MKKLFLLLTVTFLAALGAMSQTNCLVSPYDSPGVQLTPDQLAKLNSSIDGFIPLIPASYQHMVLSVLSVIGILGMLGRIYVGWKNNGFFGIITGLFHGSNVPQDVATGANVSAIAAALQRSPAYPAKGDSVLRNTTPLLMAVLLACFAVTGRAQSTNAPAPATSSVTPPASFWGGLEEAGQSFLGEFQADTNAVTSTNWTVVPFGSYDLDEKQFGYGVAVIHPLPGSSIAYVGMRLENIAGTWTAPSLNLQLQKTVSLFGLFNVTAFSVGGTALFNGNVAAYVGAGGNVVLWSFQKGKVSGAIGVAGDYEQWAGLSAHASQRQIRFGPSIGLSF